MNVPPIQAPGMTHLPLLVQAVVEAKGPVLECGAGHYSTPVLSRLCQSLGVPLVTVERDPEWRRWAEQFGHPVVTTSTEVPIRHWGVVFLDHDNEDRLTDRVAFAHRTRYMVIHDTIDTDTYPEFAFFGIDARIEPWTSLLAHEPPTWATGLSWRR